MAAAFDCYVGNPYYDTTTQTWKCTGGTVDPIKVDTSVMTVKPKLLGLPAVSLSTSRVDWVKAHPFIIAGGVGILFYFFFVMRRGGRSRFGG